MNIAGHALRISPNYRSHHWKALSKGKAADWPRAVEIVRDRLEGRFFRFANGWLDDPHSGFVVLAVDSLLAETIQQFRTGDTTGKHPNGRMRTREHFLNFLAGPRFQPHFDSTARTRFYEDIRCGLLHQAEAKEMWLVRRGLKKMLTPAPKGKGYIIDVNLFHEAMRLSLDDYYRDIVDPAQATVRDHLWTKMDHICRIRDARGLQYADGNRTTNAQEST